MTDQTTPNPGSPAAIKRGCTCDVEKNRGGAGQPINFEDNVRFTIALYCPIHSDFKKLRDE